MSNDFLLYVGHCGWCLRSLDYVIFSKEVWFCSAKELIIGKFPFSGLILFLLGWFCFIFVLSPRTWLLRLLQGLANVVCKSQVGNILAFVSSIWSLSPFPSSPSFPPLLPAPAAAAALLLLNNTL